MYVKICGITNARDAELAASLGASALGFVFTESKRKVDPAAVASITRGLPARVLTVGVFRDDPLDDMLRALEVSGVQAAQLHGDEQQPVVDAVRRAAGWLLLGRPATAYAGPDTPPAADVYIVDAPTPGSGQAFDWSVVPTLRLPHDRWMLAGGLTPRNVGDAIRAARPWGVDVSSGVEAAPGRKDPQRLRTFMTAALGNPAAGGPVPDAAS